MAEGSDQPPPPRPLEEETPKRTDRPPLEAYDVQPYDPLKDQESVRGQLALLLIFTLIGIVVATLIMGTLTIVYCATKVCEAQTQNMEVIKTLVSLVLTPVVGLVGAVTGFYFGARSTNSSP